MRTAMKLAKGTTLALTLCVLSYCVLATLTGGKTVSAQQAKKKKGPGINQAIASLHPTAGNKCKGIVTFSRKGKKITVTAEIEGLTPNQKHAIHIHEFGDCSDLSGKSAGGHFNPDGKPHGLPPNADRHAGDLGNLEADASGKARLTLTVDNISITGRGNGILGRAVIIHAMPDDGGQPTGNAGARIACGVIGIANVAK